jgi:hypothetical protein
VFEKQQGEEQTVVATRMKKKGGGPFESKEGLSRRYPIRASEM